jgi:hypothetical protein
MKLGSRGGLRSDERDGLLQLLDAAVYPRTVGTPVPVCSVLLSAARALLQPTVCHAEAAPAYKLTKVRTSHSRACERRFPLRMAMRWDRGVECEKSGGTWGLSERCAGCVQSVSAFRECKP